MAKKATSTDITKLGPQGYRQLQEANDAAYIQSDPDMAEFMKGLKPIGHNMDPYQNAPREIDIPSLGATEWGESMFDNPNTTISGLEHLGDIRAENQPWFAKIGAGLAKGAVLAGTTFLNGTLGLLYGIGTAINEGKWSGLWDNDFSNAMDDLNQWSEEVLPNYYTEDEIDNPMALRNIFSANFWGDKFIKNIGFTVGAFYSGGIYSKGLGAILKAVKAGTKTTSIVQQGVGSVLSAVNEGSFEALNAANEFEQKYRPAIDDNYRQRIQAIQAEYEANKGKQMVRVGEGNQMVDPAYVKYQQDIARERDNYNKAIAKLQQDKARVGNTTLLLNIPILTASNIYQFGKLYSKGFNTARKTADVVMDETGKYAARNTSKLYRAGRILGGGLAEGNEEVAQQLASDTQQHYYGTDFNNFYRSLQDPEAAQETLDWAKSFGETISRTMGEASTWEQFMIGSLTGFLGMPRFRGIRNAQGNLQSPVVLQGNMFSRWRELSQETARNQSIANELNARVNSPEFKNYYQGLIRHKKYQNDMDDATLRDDEFDFKNAEHAQLLSDIDMFSKAGRLEDLKSMVSDALDISDTNLDAIVKNTTTVDKSGKLVGPYAKYAVKNNDGSISSNFGNEESKQEMITSLTQDRDEVMNTINEYEKIRNELDDKSGYRFTEEQLDELTWMKSQLGNWAKRAVDMSGQMKDVIGKVIGRLESQRQAAEAIRTHEGMAHADLSENYKRADRIIQSIDEIVKNLDFIRSLDNEAMAATLAKNPKILEGLKERVGKLDNEVMSADDKKDVTKKLDDLARLGSASDIFRNKFNEYLLNPTKIDEDHAKVNEENTKKNEEVDKAAQIDGLNKTTTFKEVQDIIDNGDALMEDLDKSSSEAAKSFKKANLFKKKAAELINASDSPHKDQLLEALNRRFNENSNYDDLTNTQLVTDFSPEVATWDEIEQETFINEFNNILKQASDKVSSGNSQKQNVDTPKNGTKSQGTQGHDNVGQPPASETTDNLDISSDIDKLSIPDEIKAQAKSLAKIIADKIKSLGNRKDVKIARNLQKQANALYDLVGNKVIKPLVDKIRELSTPEVFNPGTPEDVQNDNSYEATQVTGVLKAVIPEFDLDAKKKGILMPFVGENRNQTFAYVYNKLSEVDPKTGLNAFDYVDEGNIKEGDELEVRYEPATDEHPELLALYHNGTLVNYMNTDENIAGVKEIKDRAKKNEPTTVRVSKIMNGMVPYDMSKTQSIGTLLGADDAVLGVKTAKSNQLQANTDKYIEPVYDTANADGKVYILIPNAKGSLTPKQVYVRHLNRGEFNLDNENGPIASDLKRMFTEISKLPTATDLDSAIDNIYMDLVELLYIPDSFFIGAIQKGSETYLQISFPDRNGVKQRREVLLKKVPNQSIAHFGAGGPSTTEGFTANPDDVYRQIVDIFYEANLAFNVNANKLAGKNGQAYANRLRDSNVIATYLTGKRMQGSWFLLNEEPNSHDSRDSFNRSKAAKQAKGGVRVVYNGHEYYVRGDTIYDETGSIADLGSNSQEVMDLAYIESAYGGMMYGANEHDGMVLIKDKNGERGYNRKTGKYLTASELDKLKSIINGNTTIASKSAKAVDNLFTSQAKVLRLEDGRPDTSSGAYRVLEDDGQYHDYERVHTVIGSNWLGGKRDDSSATDNGNVVDTIAREFFIDPTSVSRPESMSEVAYRSLISHLGKIRNKLRTEEGFEIRTDRIVVFHKYDDNTRIAGEIDLFAYNPTTGEVRIYDFKTSRYSTKDTAFSKVVRPELFSRSNKDQYTLQLSAYAKLFEDEFRFPVSKITILPIQIAYEKDKSKVGAIRRVNPEAEIELKYNSSVFVSNPERASVKRTFTGQYITTRGGVHYHTAPMTEIFTRNGITYYITKVGDQYKLVLQNGSSLTIQEPALLNALSSNDAHEIEVQLLNFVETENVKEEIQDMLRDKYINDSPYGTSIEVKTRPQAQPTSTFSVDNKVHYTVSSGEGNGTVTKVSPTGKTITVKRDSDGREIEFAPNLLTKSATQASQASQSDNKAELNKNEPKDVKDRVAISSSAEQEDNPNYYPKNSTGDVTVFGRDPMKEHITAGRKVLLPSDGRVKVRDAGGDKVVTFKTKSGNTNFAVEPKGNYSGRRGGAISVAIWRDPTDSEKIAIEELLEDTFISGTEPFTTWEEFASKVDAILHGNIPNIQPSQPTQTSKPKAQLSERDKEALASIRVFDSLRADNGTPDKKKEEALDKREKDKKAEIKIALDTPLGKEQLTRKNWSEMTDDEKTFVKNNFGEDVGENDVKAYWDGINPEERASIFDCP